MLNENELCTVNLRIQNKSSRQRLIYVEPWGEQVPYHLGETYEIIASGPRGNYLEVVLEETAITIVGWSGSVLSVLAWWK